MITVLPQLVIRFRTDSLIEMRLALHSATFVMMKEKGFLMGFREIFGGECFILEITSFLQRHKPKEFDEILSQVGISLAEYTEAVADFNSHAGEKVNTGSATLINNRMTTKV